MKKDIRKKLQEWGERGWIIRKTKNNHFKLTHPNGHKTVFASSTPSDSRSIKNIEEDMRHALDPKYKSL